MGLSLKEIFKGMWLNYQTKSSVQTKKLTITLKTTHIIWSGRGGINVTDPETGHEVEHFGEMQHRH